MLKVDHKFVIEMLTHGGEPLGQFPVAIDWEPAHEHLRMTALRRGGDDHGGDDAPARVEPVWEESEGEPRAAGARVIRGDFFCEVSPAYFKSLATGLSSGLVEKKILKDGELFRYKLLAYRQEPEPANGDAVAFTVRAVTPPLRFVEGTVAELQSGCVPCGKADPADLPVFIPQSVLDEVEAITLDAGSMETGGILIGCLHRDAAIPEIAVVVTAQIPARHTEAKSTSLTFTAETWTAVRAALDLRKSGEMMCGWWHSHPSFAFCGAECPPERRRTCALQKPFLSTDDLVLHRTVFPKAYHVALLANNADAGLGFALFGWRGGLVQPRGFAIRNGRRAAEADPDFSTEPSTGEKENGTPCKK